MPTALRYALLQIPGIVFVAGLLLALWWVGAMSMRTGGALLAMWVVKDIAVYPLLRSAYEGGGAHGAARLVGRTGVTRQRLAPQGYVTVGGELWRAELVNGAAAIEAGARVRVVAGRRLTLVVVPIDDGRAAAPQR